MLDGESVGWCDAPPASRVYKTPRRELTPSVAPVPDIDEETGVGQPLQAMAARAHRAPAARVILGCVIEEKHARRILALLEQRTISLAVKFSGGFSNRYKQVHRLVKARMKMLLVSVTDAHHLSDSYFVLKHFIDFIDSATRLHRSGG